MATQSFQERIVAPMTSKRFFEFFAVPPEQFSHRDILNVGAGGQDFKEELKQKNVLPNSVVNIDLGYNSARKSDMWRLLFKLPRKSFPDNAVQGDWDNLPLEALSFDDAIISFSGAFWTDGSDFIDMMSELMRVTKENIYMTGTNIENMKVLERMPEILTGSFTIEELSKGYILHRKV
jgi:hypothetical protein